jgi:ribonuclease Z
VIITLLGTGSPLPDAARAGPATLVRSEGTCVLVDCGRGVVMRLVAAGVLPMMLDAVLVTHLHSDHVTDLNDLITTHWIMAPEHQPLRIFGPLRIREVVEATLAALDPDIDYRLAHRDDLTWRPNVEVVEVTAGESFAGGGATVTVGRSDHRPVEPSVAYRIDDGDRSVVVAGDGVPCDDLTELCRRADAYVQTVIRDDLVRAIPNARLQDILDYHSTVEQAAETASRAQVGVLVLTHYVPALQPGAEEEWRARAAAHFAGTIVLGDDLTSLQLPARSDALGTPPPVNTPRP